MLINNNFGLVWWFQGVGARCQGQFVPNNPNLLWPGEALLVSIDINTNKNIGADPEGGGGGGGGGRGSGAPILENHKNIGFLSKTGLDPLKITKLPSQHSMQGHHLNGASKCVL